MSKSAMIQEIIICCKANNVPTTGELLISLAFMSESALRSMCHELHIRT